ncbi:MAG: restriction endonuclease subunit S [Hydrococcus sp. Prado102]|nr:restriction endonuclease subunit S [Hydrococcus sp. Prado102]
MTIPAQIAALIEQINQNLAQIEIEATEGLNFSRAILDRFPNNAKIIQFFASFNNAILFVELQRRRIISIVQNFSTTDTTTEAEIQEVGEDLSEELGRVIETKLLIHNLKQRLEELL